MRPDFEVKSWMSVPPSGDNTERLLIKGKVHDLSAMSENNTHLPLIALLPSY